MASEVPQFPWLVRLLNPQLPPAIPGQPQPVFPCLCDYLQQPPNAVHPLDDPQFDVVVSVVCLASYCSEINYKRNDPEFLARLNNLIALEPLNSQFRIHTLCLGRRPIAAGGQGGGAGQAQQRLSYHITDFNDTVVVYDVVNILVQLFHNNRPFYEMVHKLWPSMVNWTVIDYTAPVTTNLVLDQFHLVILEYMTKGVAMKVDVESYLGMAIHAFQQIDTEDVLRNNQMLNQFFLPSGISNAGDVARGFHPDYIRNVFQARAPVPFAFRLICTTKQQGSGGGGGGAAVQGGGVGVGVQGGGGAAALQVGGGGQWQWMPNDGLCLFSQAKYRCRVVNPNFSGHWYNIQVFNGANTNYGCNYQFDNDPMGQQHGFGHPMHTLVVILSPADRNNLRL